MHSEPPPGIVSHEGVVHSVGDDEAIVAVAKGGCSACGKKAACGIGKLTAGTPTTLVRVPAAGISLQAGDAVTVTVGEAALARGALLGYLLPAAAIVVGAGVGQTIYGTDIAAATAALVGIIIAVFTTRRLGSRYPQSLAPLTLHKREK